MVHQTAYSLLLAILAPVVFVAVACAQPGEVWTMRLDGTGLKRLLHTPGYTCGSPEWSPDGKWVAYDTWRVDQTLHDSQLVVVRADGTTRRELGIGAMPTWSPDGKLIAFHTYGINLNGTAQLSAHDQLRSSAH